MKNNLSIIQLILIIVFSISQTAFSQNYLWPTNSSQYMSSSFCEFREGHYHAAIDIKTWNTEGYPCYAIADGYIKKIQISPFGYGKVLYLQLKDGNTAIYAHLQKFPKEIEKQIRDRQFKNKQYRLVWWPNNIKVKKGEIIAFTGRTGTGVPHLHFEIRNSKDNPINPLRFYTQVKDHKRPILQNLAVIPLSQTARVNDSYFPCIFPVKHIKDDIYVIKQPIYVQGKIGLAVDGYDQADDVYNKYGFYQSNLESAGKLIFQLRYDELEYSTTKHIYTEIYYPFLVDNRQVFNKLYLEPFNPLNFYNRKLESNGSITVTDKPIPFTITITDFMKNKSIISGELLPIRDYSVDILDYSVEDSNAYINFSAPTIDDLKIYTKKQNQPWTLVKYFEILSGKINNPDQNKLLKVSLDDSNLVAMKIRVNDKIERTLSLVGKNKRENTGEIFTFLGNKIIAEFPDTYKNPRIQNSPHQVFVSSNLSENEKLQVVLPAKFFTRKELTFLIDDYLNNTVSTRLNCVALIPGKRQIQTWFDSTLVLKSNTGSVTDTTIITASILEKDSSEFNVPVASDIFEVKPNNFPIFESMSISIQTDSLPKGDHWSVFQINGDEKFNYLSTRIDSTTRFFTAQISSFGKFIIAADTIPPEVTIDSPKANMIYRSNPNINLSLKDDMSGIGDENNISLSIDGDYVLPEWDPEEDLVAGMLEHELAAGDHLLSASISDRSGNITHKTVLFKIQ